MLSKGIHIAVVAGNRERLRLIRRLGDRRKQLWCVTHALQKGLTENRMRHRRDRLADHPGLSRDVGSGRGRPTGRLRGEYNIYCSFVVHPIVPRGIVQLRIAPMALHTEADVKRTIDTLVAVREE